MKTNQDLVLFRRKKSFILFFICRFEKTFDFLEWNFINKSLEKKSILDKILFNVFKLSTLTFPAV